jgi:hypothetical protein
LLFFFLLLVEGPVDFVVGVEPLVETEPVVVVAPVDISIRHYLKLFQAITKNLCTYLLLC